MNLPRASIVLALLALAAAKELPFEGYKVIRVDVPDEEHARILSKYDGPMDFWGHIRIGHHVDILVPPTKANFASLLERMGFTYSINVENLAPVFAESEAKRLARRARAADTADFDFDMYHTYEEITQFLMDTANEYTTASTEVIGQTYEGRDMTVLKICSGNCGDNPVMYIECGIHAREWLTDAVCLNMISELTKNAAANSEYTSKLDWYFLTPANPDGYAYTWSDPTNRFWRKTRSPNAGSTCVGTDPNRNFDEHWSEEGASGDPCDVTYYGSAPFSEKCTQNIRDFVTRVKPAYFMDLHAFSELAMYPWGWTRTPSDDDAQLGALCNLGQTAIQNTHGIRYTCGPIATTIYPASGSTVDWAYDKVGIVRSFTIETRPDENNGLAGFAPDEDQIKPTSEEIWNWHKVMADDVIASMP